MLLQEQIDYEGLGFLVQVLELKTLSIAFFGVFKIQMIFIS